MASSPRRSPLLNLSLTRSPILIPPLSPLYIWEFAQSLDEGNWKKNTNTEIITLYLSFFFYVSHAAFWLTCKVLVSSSREEGWIFALSVCLCVFVWKNHQDLKASVFKQHLQECWTMYIYINSFLGVNLSYSPPPASCISFNKTYRCVLVWRQGIKVSLFCFIISTLHAYSVGGFKCCSAAAVQRLSRDAGTWKQTGPLRCFQRLHDEYLLDTYSATEQRWLG